MKLLAVGHSLVIDSNRKFWSEFSRLNAAEVDLIAPREWSSNLSNRIGFYPEPKTDAHLRHIYPVKAFFKGKGSFFFFDPLSTLRILRSEKYDAIYLNQETWALSTLVFIFLKCFSRNARTPLFLCVAQNIKKQRLRFLHPYERLIARFVTAFLYCSEGVMEVLRWKGITRPCVYFPLPYDDQSYSPSIQGPQSEEFRIGYLGRLSEDKGLPLLLKVMDELQRESKGYRLTVGGNGPLAEELRSRPYVSFKGLIPHSKASEFYKDIDCFVLPSQTRPHWKEQFGRVIVEAFAAGKPVIGSDSGSIPEVLGKLEWPWTFREDSAEELRDLIQRLRSFLQSEEGLRSLEHSIDRNMKTFSQTVVAKELFNTFREYR